MENEVIIERLTKVEERAKSNTNQINDMKPVINEIHELSNTMVQLLEEIKHTNQNVGTLSEKVEKMDCRVNEMEKAPADDYKIYKRTAVTAIISCVATAFATGAIFMIAQYIN